MPAPTKGHRESPNVPDLSGLDTMSPGEAMRSLVARITDYFRELDGRLTGYGTKHASTHLPAGTDALTVGTPSAIALANAAGTPDPGDDEAYARADHDHGNIKRDVRVAKTGVDVGTRNRLNFLEAIGVSITVTDDSGGDEIDIAFTTAGEQVRLPDGEQDDLALAFEDQPELGIWRHSNMQMHIPSATTGDGGIFLALADGGFVYVVPIDDEGFSSIDAYDETYGAGIFNRVDGSAAAGNTMGFARATHVFMAAYGRAVVTGTETAHDAIIATNALERIRLDGTTGAAKFAHNLVVTPRSPAQLTASVNDYDPGGNQGFLRLSSDAAWNVTGMVAGPDGAQRVITNVGAFNITLKNADGASAAANQFLNASGADVVLAPNQMAQAVYDGTTQRWRVGKFA